MGVVYFKRVPGALLAARVFHLCPVIIGELLCGEDTLPRSLSLGQLGQSRLGEGSSLGKREIDVNAGIVCLRVR